MSKSHLILVVDDEEDIRETLKSVLEDEGFGVETAKDGSECLKKLKIKKLDLIILDILMPGPTTREIVAEIKKQKIKTPIILLTVVRLAEAVKQEIAKGNIVDYMEKPFDNKDLIKRIKKVLDV